MDVESIPCFKEMFMSRKLTVVSDIKLKSKFNNGMEVLYIVNEINKLAVIHRSSTNDIISVSFIEPGNWFVVLL